MHQYVGFSFNEVINLRADFFELGLDVSLGDIVYLVVKIVKVILEFVGTLVLSQVDDCLDVFALE